MNEIERGEIIVTEVCSFYGIDRMELYGACRVRKLAFARQIICYLARKHTSLSFNAIGKLLKRDHASVLQSVRVVDNLIDFNHYGDEVARVDKVVSHGLETSWADSIAQY